MPKINMVNFMSNVDRESWVHRLDPRTKFALILFFTSIPLFFTNWRFTLVFIALTLPFWLTANINFRPMIGPFVGVGIFLVLIFVLNAVRASSDLEVTDPRFAFDWYMKLGPVVVTSLSAAQGLFMALRLLTPLTIGLLIISTTDPTYLAKGLRKLRFPTELVFMVLAGMRFIPIVTEQLFNILDAQTIRGVSSSRIERTRLLLLPLFITSLRRVRSLGLATEAKGFGASRWNDFYEEFGLRYADKTILVTLIVLTITSLVIRFGFGLGAGDAFHIIK
jgi:energy-coupling factor transport system permease protein